MQRWGGGKLQKYTRENPVYAWIQKYNGIKEGREGHRGCIVINDVDVTNYTGKCSNEEMSHMDREGHDHIFHTRNMDRHNDSSGCGRGDVNPPEVYDYSQWSSFQ